MALRSSTAAARRVTSRIRSSAVASLQNQNQLLLGARREDHREQQPSAIRAFHATPQRESAILLAGLGVAGAAMGAKYVIQVRLCARTAK